MKKVLMIAYSFPPVAGSGVWRVLKYVRHLPNYQWEPNVLTVHSAYNYYQDHELLNEIGEDSKVFRTASFEPMKAVRKLLKFLSDTRAEKKGEVVMSRKRVKKPRWMRVIKEHIFIPDGEIGWLPFAVFKGLQIIRKEKIDVIFSTAPPFTTHLIACCLKKITGKPWLADFRDPWSLNSQAHPFPWRRFWDRKLEHWVLKNASSVVAITKIMEKEFWQLYPQGHYSTILNGYDESDFKNSPEMTLKSDKFTITHIGILYKQRSPKYFLLALKEIFSEQPHLRQKWQVLFVGQLDNPGDTENYRFLTSLNFDDVVQLVDYVPHRKSIEYALTSDVLLLIVDSAPANKGIMTGKIFEYLRSGTPVLGLVPPDGVAAGVIHETNAGLVIDSQSVGEIKEALLHLYELYQTGKLQETFQRKNVSKYSSENLTQEMSRELNSLLDKNQEQNFESGSSR